VTISIFACSIQLKNSQRWNLEFVDMHDHSAIVEDKAYRIRNEATGNYLRAYGNLTSIPFSYDDDSFKVRLRSAQIDIPFANAVQFTFKHQDDSGVSMRAHYFQQFIETVNKYSPVESSHRLIPLGDQCYSYVTVSLYAVLWMLNSSHSICLGMDLTPPPKALGDNFILADGKPAAGSMLVRHLTLSEFFSVLTICIRNCANSTLQTSCRAGFSTTISCSLLD
jgi:hypothetical protein